MNRSALEVKLGPALLRHPAKFEYRYDERAKCDLLQLLFRSMTGGSEEYLRMLFPHGAPDEDEFWKLSVAQGAVEGAEYTAAARGKRCGHVFKAGEASYHCLTCSTDDTCALCSRCFDASDHTGHNHTVYVSGGHSGCCDCGDDEAFRIPVNCAIHTDLEQLTEKEKKPSRVPAELVESIRATVALAFDYFCDVISCSPEQLRLPKTEEGIRQDEVSSRLASDWYGGSDLESPDPEFALVLWNDEKHTITEVRNQVARACRERDGFGLSKAKETNDIGRSVVKYSKDLPGLLGVSRIIEHIKVTVTVRSARDTYREQMCETIIEWFSDIANCSVHDDNVLLRHIICEQMLEPWRTGSGASNIDIGQNGIDDHTLDEYKPVRTTIISWATTQGTDLIAVDLEPAMGVDEDEQDEDNDGIEVAMEDDGHTDEDMAIDAVSLAMAGDDTMHGADVDMDGGSEEEMETAEFSQPNPTTGTPGPAITERDVDGMDTATPSSSRERSASGLESRIKIPKTPGTNTHPPPDSVSYWVEKPKEYRERSNLPYEDLNHRTRLDWLILYDLRLWKKARTDVRELFIGTVVNVPEFKRILGLRFSGLYTALAQLYLIADREPDHSIIKLSLQLLTTPSITKEVVDHSNFFTSIMAIIYTFLTTRQVGEPYDVDPTLTLAMDSGSIANRRLYHFFIDLRYILPSEYVQSKIRTERQYLLQFLDLVKLTQGICPNVRAVGEHVEYETDAWIGASLLMREITRLCRLFCEAFRPDKLIEGESHLAESIVNSAIAAMVNSVGLERKRFEHCEIKGFVRFKSVPYLEFEIDSSNQRVHHRIVDFVVERGSISFHHALHYTLSWQLECARRMARETVRSMLVRAANLAKVEFTNTPAQTLDSDDILLAMFDYPIRVCAWLAQMKASMWVRNGMSLRHQMIQYRTVLYRDFAYYRDIFMIQAALAVLDPSRVLATLSDRFGIAEWMQGGCVARPDYENAQHVDVAEEFIHLLITLISERTSLTPNEDEKTVQRHIIRRDIAHALCFRPLAYTDLTARISDKVVDLPDFQTILEQLAIFRPPDGMNDSGTFELRPEYISLVDPYALQYSKNQRDEAENIYKRTQANATGKNANDIVFEPKLTPISTGLFSGVSEFTRTPLFAQLIHQHLEYCLMYKFCTPNITHTRIEALLHVLFHLILLAVLEDENVEDDDATASPSFVFHSLSKKRQTQLGELNIVELLQKVATVQEFESCAPKIRRILKGLWQKRPNLYAAATKDLSFPYDNFDTQSPAPGLNNEAEQKKKRALERQAKIMAQFQQQQQNFLSNQETFDWGEEETSDTEKSPEIGHTEIKTWKYPSGNCILCQEDTNDSKLYGTFGLITESVIFRHTDREDPAFVREVLTTPSTLDRSADSIRPFGVAGENREKVRQLDSTGGEVIIEKQTLGKGFPSGYCTAAPVTTGCGHIMHYSCFEAYYNATRRRHHQQVARNHPERLACNEFVCPLCKALGNTFLPIIWKGKEELYPGVLNASDTFSDFLNERIIAAISRFRNHALIAESDKLYTSGYQEVFLNYIAKNWISPLSNKADHLIAHRFLDTPGFTHGPPRGSIPGYYPPEERPPISNVFQIVNGTMIPSDSPMSELVQIYSRLRDTMRSNSIPSRYDYQPTRILPEDLVHTDVLFKSFAFSITAVEMAQRGQQGEPGSTLLDAIPEITLTHLRIISETAFSYASIGGLHGSSTKKTGYEFRDMHTRKLCQLFLGHPDTTGFEAHARDKKIDPLFSEDTFAFLAEFSLGLTPVLNIDIIHIVRLCYIAEIVKTLFTYALRPTGLGLELMGGYAGNESKPTIHNSSNISSIKALTDWLFDVYTEGSDIGPELVPLRLHKYHNSNMIPDGLLSLLPKYILPFLRKTVILLHVQHGVQFPNTGEDSDYLSELDRLTTLLHLPSIEEVIDSLVMIQDEDPLRDIVKGWITHWGAETSLRGVNAPLPLLHPAIFELVGLPKYFDVLLEEANQRRCPATGRELTDPIICLFCGEIFCGQSSCCTANSNYGGCNRHLAKCGKNVGLYITIRKCAVLFLHNRNGCYQFAPYLDIHGEVDPGFRHHRRLILNQKRYDRLLRDVWLSHGIPATVSRRLEAEMNNGGWETL
ncbi:hypothetical protein FQN57_000556 [Myotisia sp. PD_48]|nr:hypothetical protein FQN57_000556 [Myotisia sp. PD_48]